MSKAKDKPVTFEQAIAELEQIVERIESGQIGLEESLTYYERGMALRTHCEKILAAVQGRIAELTADARGRLRVQGEEAAAGDAGAQGGDDDSADDAAPHDELGSDAGLTAEEDSDDPDHRA